jgi:hypothetical protein
MGRALPLKGRLPLVGASAVVCLAAASPTALAHEHDGKPLTRARFLHAVPMAAPATLIVHGHPPRIPSSYGKPSEYFDCHPGPARVELKLKGQKKPAATAELEIGRGRYTVIAVPDGDKVGLRVYKDGTATPGRARMRTINAASELDEADMRVDGQQVSRFGADEATGYASVPPGRHNLSVTRPGGEGGAIASAQSVPLVAGSASTAIVVGSGGEPAEVLLVSDQTAGPSVAPATGFVEDLGDGNGWLIVLLSAVAAGWLGGTAYLLSARRGHSAGVLIAPALPEPPPVFSLPRPEAPAPPPRPPQSRPETTRERSWAPPAAAAVTAWLLYKARRRRRG